MAAGVRPQASAISTAWAIVDSSAGFAGVTPPVPLTHVAGVAAGEYAGYMGWPCGPGMFSAVPSA